MGKFTLAFFLVLVAASMVFLWMLRPPAGDASLIGLLAGFVTLFIKMAADAIGYQFNSSAGSDRKSDMLAQAAPPTGTGNGAPTAAVVAAAEAAAPGAAAKAAPPAAENAAPPAVKAELDDRGYPKQRA